MRGRRALAVAVAAGALLGSPVVASAQGGAVPGPPPVDPSLRPVDTTPAPRVPTERTGPCASTSVGEAGAVPALPWAQGQLDYQSVWPFGRGEGQTIAVIDTGVTPGPRLAVVPGGDYVSPDGDGTTDCDVHGSVVASILGAQPDPDDPTGYAGVAPGAVLLGIRQYSAQYRAVGTVPDAAGAVLGSGYGDVDSLARAVVRAADLGATVINISEAACGPAGQVLAGDGALGAALQHVVDVRDVVVVAAAGNVDPQGGCTAQNDPAAQPPVVATVASPAWYDEYVLTVGSVGQDGSPSGFSLAGPWVDVAAPGTGIVALNPAPGGPELVDSLTVGSSTAPIQGTSFAAPYAAGTVALVRQRFPELTARQVMARLEATAHGPAGGWNPQVGHGAIDPVAAVTAVLPADVGPRGVSAASLVLAPAPPVPGRDDTPRTVALAGSAALLVLAALTLTVQHAVRRARTR